MYDIFGDIHGHADILEEMLQKMGYRREDGCYRHKGRKAIFLGDLIDGGPMVRETLNIVRPMVENEAAQCILGNHEFNAICYGTKNRFGQHYREHSSKNSAQYKATLSQIPDESERREYLDWFATFPFFIETELACFVHACWSPDHLATITSAIRENPIDSFEFLDQATNKGNKLYEAIDVVLKGPEVQLPSGCSFLDVKGHERTAARIRWYEDTAGKQLADSVMSVGAGATFPNLFMDELEFDRISVYSQFDKPLFFGHYKQEHPEKIAPTLLRDNVCCLDFISQKGTSLTSYRFYGEPKLDHRNFITLWKNRSFRG